MLKVHLARIKGLIDQAIDLRRLELGRKRQDLICRGESPDYSPLILRHCKQFLGSIIEVNLNDLESFPRAQQALEHIQYFGQNLPEGMKTSCPVAVGPLTTTDMILWHGYMAAVLRSAGEVASAVREDYWGNYQIAEDV